MAADVATDVAADVATTFSTVITDLKVNNQWQPPYYTFSKYLIPHIKPLLISIPKIMSIS